ncbi:DNA-binding protein [Stenotrophomonas sp.]|uniref:DNA-binding protein n=1 Tax=Stenotrophomonas sp. TaxID=69392 RepID=UPI0028ADBEE5|nr:DNA-binding protein [Stenotrophomonas sp.]
MARGITELDVHQAADELVVGGERPTVERIRAHLGTGSPNTVTRHLDTWWSSVGVRLRQRRPDVPEAVNALAQRCWAAAVEAATEHAVAAVAGERADLVSAQMEWAAQRDAADQEQTQLRAARAAAEQQAATATAAAEALRDQVRLLGEQLEDLRHHRDGAYARNERLDTHLATLRAELEQQQVQHATEREELHAHLRATEDRSLAEVDRARQALQQLQHSCAAQTRQHQGELAALLQARVKAEHATADAQRRLGIQTAVASAYASQLGRLGDLPEQVRTALDATRARAPRSHRSKTSATKP